MTAFRLVRVAQPGADSQGADAKRHECTLGQPSLARQHERPAAAMLGAQPPPFTVDANQPDAFKGREQKRHKRTALNFSHSPPQVITGGARPGAGRAIESACRRRRRRGPGLRPPLLSTQRLRHGVGARHAPMPSHGARARQPGAGGSDSRLGSPARPERHRVSPQHVMHAR